jgi:ribosomal protein S18 acetylase RimI-like enzyme
MDDAVSAPEPARTPEWAPALRLLFRHLPTRERDRREAAALGLIDRGEFDPRGLFVLRGSDGLQGAVACLPVAGAAALLWPPAVRVGGAAAEDRLLHHALGWLRGQGVKLVQALLAPEDEPAAAPLLRHGLARVTDLHYLRHERGMPLRGIDTPARLSFEPFDPEHPATFQETLWRTYEDTQDCPEIGGARTLEEVMAGHRAQGLFDPDRWWLAREGHNPVGVLLLTELPETGDWDLAYMGVVRSARRRGLAWEMLLKALAEARAADAPRVVLSVDARNRPAWQLYRAAGFEPFDRRAVYLAVWGGGRPN